MWFTRQLFPCNCCSPRNKGHYYSSCLCEQAARWCWYQSIPAAERQLASAWWARAVHVSTLGRSSLLQTALNYSWARCMKASRFQWEAYPCQTCASCPVPQLRNAGPAFFHLLWSLDMEIQGNWQMTAWDMELEGFLWHQKNHFPQKAVAVCSVFY